MQTSQEPKVKDDCLLSLFSLYNYRRVFIAKTTATSFIERKVRGEEFT